MFSNTTIYQVDAFADKPFKGNPAGVMLLENAVSEEWMQNMAMEMNLSETAFVLPVEDYFEIRFFTPTVEIPLCGHATLASAHVMYEVGLISKDESNNFKAKGGDLVIKYDASFVAMTFPEYTNTKIEIPENFKTSLGFQPVELYASNDNWLVAVAEHQTDIENCTPNFETLVSNGLGQLMITSKASLKDVDFVVRCFVPEAGINEDPVTGSAHCALTPLWSKKLEKSKMISHQISKRGGVLNLTYSNNSVKRVQYLILYLLPHLLLILLHSLLTFEKHLL